MNRQAIKIGRGRIRAVLFLVLAGVLMAGCEGTKQGTGAKEVSSIQQDRNGSEMDTQAILERVAVDEALTTTRSTSTAPVGPVTGKVSFSEKDISKYTPDPLDVGLKDIMRARQVQLSLQDAVSRALANNFKIKTEGYGPAISAMDILQAEANFDAVYFLDANLQKVDQPTDVKAFPAIQQDQRTLTSGLRKLLPTGAVITGAYNMIRLDPPAAQTAGSTAVLNPSYTSNFAVELRQPILRGFGLDYNRAMIDVSKNNQQVAKYRFRETVRDQLLEVEKAYWRLVQARRNVVIQQTLVKQTEETYEYLKLREKFDVYKVQITRVKALLGTRMAEYVQVKNTVRDAEDQLKALMNDPDLNLGEDIEIIPKDFPTLGPLVVDQIGEVQQALECRSEIQEAKALIDNRRINVAVAKNQALPKFDLTFRYTLNGMSDNWGNSIDQMTTSNFQDYFVGLSFEYPIGNRGPRAAQRKAILERDQAIAGLKQVIENVILEVDVAVRNLQTAYHQVAPSTEAVQASEENLDAIVARKIKLSPEFLEVQLNAQETLANARRGLLAALVNYNIAIVQLERAKDTLLRYDNISMKSE